MAARRVLSLRRATLLGLGVAAAVAAALGPREGRGAGVIDASAVPGLDSFVELTKTTQPEAEEEPTPAAPGAADAAPDIADAAPDDHRIHIPGWIIDHLPKGVAERAKEWMPRQLPEHSGMLLTPLMFGFSMVVLSSLSFLDLSPGSKKAPIEKYEILQPWSLASITALTSYKFYTGFLSATWMPYLLAMEGHAMVESRQSVFMGCAKLIYGLSVMLNPMFGLAGDQVAVWSRWTGRRLFVLAGVGACGLGIYGCLVAAHLRSVYWYMAATVLWMLGEAMADVTTETLVPELLPKSQYEISAAIRSLNFLVGGLVGYACLIVFRGVHYSWLYYAYLVVMVVCAFLTLCFIRSDDVRVQVLTPGQPRRAERMSMSALFYKAYVVPANYAGGFPRACLCLFLFSLGSAPMFFLLLMVRDIVGITDQETMQFHFGIISAVFFIMAAVASLFGAAVAVSREDAAEGTNTGQVDELKDDDEDRQGGETREVVDQRWKLMVASTIFFGLVCAVIPLCGVPATVNSRLIAFYFVGSCLGLAFGSVYTRFQECTWSLLPARVDIANAMGFAAMTKLAGVGLGNFGAGFILDAHVEEETGDSYGLAGYVVMCSFCSVTVFASAWLASTIWQKDVAKFGSTQGA